MSNRTEKIAGTEEAWDTEELGADAKFVRRVSDEKASEIEDALCLQMISIRLDKELIETFKHLAVIHGVGYQPLMRDALRRFAESELKQLAARVSEEKQSASKHATSQSAKVKARKAA